MTCEFEHLFQPLQIKGLRFRNRIFSTPNAARFKGYNGSVQDQDIAYYAAKAMGGAAQVSVGETMVNWDYVTQGRGCVLNIHDYNNIAGLNELAHAISAYGAIPSIQLTHPGKFCSPEAMDGRHFMSSSACVRPDGVIVDEMDEEMMAGVIEDFANSARIVKDAGFQMLELHGAHGWLLAEFLSPIYNKRKDSYGGSLENRAKFPIRVIEAVRKAVGGNFPIEYRISGDEILPEGMRIEDTIAFIKMIEDKIDIIHVSAGLHDQWDINHYTFPHTEFTQPGCNVKYAAAVKKAGIKIPVETVGGITSPQQAERILSEGQADIIGMARALIADPEFPNKARRGQEEDVIPCLRCSECITGVNSYFTCQVNPTTARFASNINLPKTCQPHKIVVIGGGPAGMEAAQTAVERGHDVTLIEKADSLGGQMNYADCEPLKGDLRAYRDYMVRKTLKTVPDVRLHTDATPELVKSLHPDIVIAAVGAEPIVPRIPGIDRKNVIDPITAYHFSDTKVGKKAVIIGGGFIGCELSMNLAEKGHEAVVIEVRDAIGDTFNWRHNLPMIQKMDRLENVTYFTETAVAAIDDGGVVVKDLKTGTERHIDCDTVIYSVGMKPKRELVERFNDTAVDFYPIGDCFSVGKIKDAVRTAYYQVMNIK